MSELMTTKTHEAITYKNFSPKTKWFDCRLYVPNPNHYDTYPCVVKDKCGIRIKYIAFCPEHPYDRGHWLSEDEVLWFTTLEFPHNLLKDK